MNIYDFTEARKGDTTTDAIHAPYLLFVTNPQAGSYFEENCGKFCLGAK